MQAPIQIGMLLAAIERKPSWLAQQLGVTPGAVNQMLRKRTLPVAKMEQIAEICGVKYESYFVLPDGTRIG